MRRLPQFGPFFSVGHVLAFILIFVLILFPLATVAQIHTGGGGGSGGGGFTPGGDLSGTATSQEVVGILSKSLPALTTGYLNWNGSAWVFSSVGSGNLSGTLTVPCIPVASGVHALACGSLNDNGSGGISGPATTTLTPANAYTALNLIGSGGTETIFNLGTGGTEIGTSILDSATYRRILIQDSSTNEISLLLSAGVPDIQLIAASGAVASLNLGNLTVTETTAPSGIALSDILYPDSTAHRWKMINNNGTATQVVASGVDINTSDQVVGVNGAAVPANVALRSNGSSQPVALGGTTAKAANYTFVAADNGGIFSFNGTYLVATLPSSPPTSSWSVTIQNLGSTNVFISQNGLNINGGAHGVTLAHLGVTTITTDGTNYYATPSCSTGGRYCVLDYGARGTARHFADGSCNASTTFTSATAGFTSNDAGADLWGTSDAGNTYTNTTIASVTNSTTAVLTAACTGNHTGQYGYVGFDDSAAIQATATAAKAGTLQTSPTPGIVYAPFGGYIFSSLLFNQSYGSQTLGYSVLGDGISSTVFAIAPTFTLTSGHIFDITGDLGGNAVFGGATPPSMSGFTIDGSSAPQGSAPSVVACGWMYCHDIQLANYYSTGGSYGFDISAGPFTAPTNVIENVTVINGRIGYAFALINAGQLKNTFVSNLTLGSYLYCASATTQIIGGIWDEDFGLGTNGLINATNGCGLTISNFYMYDINTASGGPAIYVSSGATVNLSQTTITRFGAESNPHQALNIQSGGIVYAGNSTFGGANSSGYAISNSGTFYDLGGNTYACPSCS